MKRWFVLFLWALGFSPIGAEPTLLIRDPYLRIDAAADDPLFTTYAAAM